jgi:lysophospholipase L1-like esterase
MMRRLLLCTLLALGAFAETKDLNWIAATDGRFEVNGLAWFGENHGEWIRLPLRLKDVVRKSVWGLAQAPSGGRIRFRSDAATLAIRLDYPSPPDMANMHAFGQTGVDLYLDGVYRGSATAKKDSKAGEAVEHIYFELKDQPRRMREVVLYLPLYKAAKVLSIGMDKDAKTERARAFAAAKPVVFYGTSITQGGCASRSGMSYQAILGRMLNLDFVNLGFSGNGLGEPEMARAVAEIDAAMFVFDFAQNNKTAAALKENYEPFLNTVRAKHPATPIVVITPIANTREALSGGKAETEGMRTVIRDVAARHIAAGDAHLQIVEGTDLLGEDRLDGMVDGVHPNDLGFQWMAEGLAPRIRKILGL